MEEFQKMCDEGKTEMKECFVIIVTFSVITINCCYRNSSISKCEWTKNCKTTVGREVSFASVLL